MATDLIICDASPASPSLENVKATPSAGVEAEELGRLVHVHRNEIGHYAGFDFVHRLEKHFASLTPAPVEARGDGWSDAQIATIWTAAMTAACNIVIHRQNDLNDEDGPMDVLNEQGQIIHQIKKWMEPDTVYLEQLRFMLGAKLATPSLAGDVRGSEKGAQALRKISDEAKKANDVIRLNRDGKGQGRVKVATALHRIEHWASSALSDAHHKPRTQEEGVQEALEAAFDFLGGVDGASEVRDKLLAALSTLGGRKETGYGG